MSRLSPFYSHLAVATSALGFAHSYTLAPEEGEPSGLLLESAISAAKNALAYLMLARDTLEKSRHETGAARARMQRTSNQAGRWAKQCLPTSLLSHFGFRNFHRAGKTPLLDTRTPSSAKVAARSPTSSLGYSKQTT